jgi:hypothetical protein
MDVNEIRAYAARMETTGLHFARLGQDPDYAGVRSVWIKVPWETAIVRLLAATGWNVVDDDGTERAALTLLREE